MKILCWNVNGFRSAYGKGLPELIARERPDVFCAQEIKADASVLEGNEFCLPDYQVFYSCATKKGYSGVATWVRKDSGLKPQLVATGIGDPRFDSEGRFVILKLGDILLYNIYFPSGTSGEERQGFKYEFLDDISAHFKSLSADDRKRCIICGDINICHREIDIHHPQEATKKMLTGFLPREREWVSSFLELGFIDAFRVLNGDLPKQYTWWSFRANSRAKNLGWRIDYFLVAKEMKNRIETAKICSEITGSDHCPIGLQVAE